MQDEILDIKDLVQKNKTKTQEIDITIKNAIADISDIVYLGFPGSVTVERTEDDIIKDIIELDNDIVAVENRHYSADFTETGRLIGEAEQFILQQIGTHRQYTIIKLFNLEPSDLEDIEMVSTDFTVYAIITLKVRYQQCPECGCSTKRIHGYRERTLTHAVLNDVYTHIVFK